jgi:hypothetical protein
MSDRGHTCGIKAYLCNAKAMEPVSVMLLMKFGAFKKKTFRIFIFLVWVSVVPSSTLKLLTHWLKVAVKFQNNLYEELTYSEFYGKQKQLR